MASIVAAILLLLPMTTAHVSLTYPPARYPPLDYLKISRSSFPCGIPRPPTESEKSASDAMKKCFNYDYPESEQSFDEHGLFKKQCYKKEEINADDVVYHRNIRDEVEVILDYASNSWVGLGWKPMDIDISCRNFPVEIKHDHIASESIPCDNSTLPLHPMHCLDLVVGSVLNGRSRIADYYTRDQATPLLDTWYHGSDSLLAAYGIRRDGRTLIMFRRKIAASEKSDHPLGPGEVFAVWAKGQEYGSYFHDPPSAIESKAVGDSHFYKPNELKYHGGLNRGVHPMEFVTASTL